MDQIWIENLRSLKATGSVDLRPINILVGQNSSGKSTLLRIFPLLKQSVETLTQSPILWYGRYVDFGSISASKRRDSDEGVTFGFRGKVKPRQGIAPAPYSLSVTMSSSDDEKSYLSRYRFEFLGSIIDLNFTDAGRLREATMDGVDFTSDIDKTIVLGTAALFPGVIELENKGKPDTAVRFEFSSNDSISESDAYPFYWGFERRLSMRKQITKVLASYFRSNTSEKRREKLVKTLYACSRKELSSLLTGAASPQALRSAFEDQGSTSSALSRVHGLMFLASFPMWILEIDKEISGMAAACSYMGPVRATAQRYYRIQDLAVKEVDFQGENLAMFLASLAENERQSLSAFASEFLGFAVRVSSASGHVEILVKERDGIPETNLADMGFGYSQVLPIVAQIWASTYTRSIKTTHKILAVEQPELHLHPRLQASLSDMFSAVVRESRRRTQRMSIFIETHSEAIINRFGALIEDGVIAESDIQILIFEIGKDGKSTEVRKAQYNESGELTGWPFGFLAG